MSLDRLILRIKVTKGIPEAIALGAGAIWGYCDARGIPIRSAAMDASLKFVPTAIHAGLGAYIGFAEGVINQEDRVMPLVLKGGVSGGLVGATETGVGYGMGYAIGTLTR